MSMKPLLLDLFCKAGGASVGYYRAGFEVVGVDIEPQPNYPYKFIQADAFQYIADHGREYDVIAASPKCQFSSGVQHLSRARDGGYPEHLDQITPLRPLLIASDKPYVIENVSGAKRLMQNSIRLCGTMFHGLKVYRHRLFESNLIITAPEHYPHRDSTPSAGNGVSPKGFISVCGTGGIKGMTSKQIIAYWSMAMGIDWMSRAELAQAIPPAYTEYIGKQIIAQL